MVNAAGAAAPDPRAFWLQPTALFWSFVAAHAAAWTVLPALLYPNPPLDIIEALVMGREWQLGYAKLPPLPWWTVEAVREIAGDRFWPFYLTAQVFVAVAFWAVWRLGRALVSDRAALVGVVALAGLHYFNFTAPKFNHDVAQLPFWSLTGLTLWRALRDGRDRDWLLLGVWLAGAFWAKYFVVVLVAPLALFILAEPQARRCLATRGPYLAAAVALALASPHLWWLVAHDFLPLAYAEARAVPPRGVLDHVIRPLGFLAGQIAALAPVGLAVGAAAWRRGLPDAARPDALAAFDRRYLATVALGPCVTLLAMSLATGRFLVALWGYPLWCFVGLFLVARLRPALDAPAMRRFAVVAGGTAVVMAGAFIVSNAVLPAFDHRYRATQFPGQAVAVAVNRAWREATGQPLAYAIGPMWLAGNVAAFAPDRPRAFVDADAHLHPWIDIADVARRGGVVLYWADIPDARPPAAPPSLAGAEPQPPLELDLIGRPGDRVRIGYAILRPRAP